MACDCIATIQAKLDERNTLLIVAGGVNCPERVVLWTEKAQAGRGKPKASRVLATFCPFCGVRYQPDVATRKAED